MQVQTIKSSILFKNAQIIDPFNEKIYTSDLLIERGKIKQLDDKIEKEGIEKVVDLNGLSLSPAFVDPHVHFREPGYENSETIATGCRAALAGGFSKVCCMPNTEPAIDNQEAVRFIYKQAEKQLVDVFPIAAITKGREGVELTEMVEMAAAGAVAFSDDGAPVANARIMRYALEYSKSIGKAIINHAEDPDLKADGLMNEGIVSTQLGIPGNPSIAEEAMIYRDLILARFTGARLHIPHVTSGRSVELIRRAKQEGIAVTAEATPHHFSLTEEYLRSFDANGKVAPPLRTEKDRQAIIQGLTDRTIDAIGSDHAPHVYDSKETSLDLASYGMIGLETAFALAMTNLVHPKHLNLLELIRLMTVRPAGIMGIELPGIKAGAPSNLTIFDPQEWWVFSRKDIYSKSRNTPFLGAEFTGRVKAMVVKNRYITL